MWFINSNMFKKLKTRFYFLTLSWTLLIFSISSARQPEILNHLPPVTNEQEAYLNEGLMLIEKFYGYMFSKDELRDCPDIFDEITGTTSTLEREKEVIQMWKYVRENTGLFTGGLRMSGSQEEFYAKAGKYMKMGFSRWGSPDGELVVAGIDIVLFSQLGVKSGIRKEISFPINFCKKRNRHVIDAVTITVNGVTLDWTTLSCIEGIRKWERDFDWLEQLGFPKKQR